MSADPAPPKHRGGPKSHRVLLYFTAALLTFLLLWFWSFVLRDIGAVTMPQWENVEKTKTVQQLEDNLDDLTSRQDAVSLTISDLEQSQRLLRDSTNSTRETMISFSKIRSSLRRKTSRFRLRKRNPLPRARNCSWIIKISIRR